MRGTAKGEDQRPPFCPLSPPTPMRVNSLQELAHGDDIGSIKRPIRARSTRAAHSGPICPSVTPSLGNDEAATRCLLPGQPECRTNSGYCQNAGQTAAIGRVLDKQRLLAECQTNSGYCQNAGQTAAIARMPDKQRLLAGCRTNSGYCQNAGQRAAIGSMPDKSGYH